MRARSVKHRDRCARSVCGSAKTEITGLMEDRDEACSFAYN